MTVVAESWHRKQRTGGPPLDLDALEEAAAHLPMCLAQANAWWLIGSKVAESGDFERARSALERSRRTYVDCGCEGKSAHPLHTLALILSHECKFEAAAEALELSAAALRRTDGESVQTAISSATATVFASQAGRVEGAGDAVDPWIRFIERSDQVAYASFVGCFQAELYEAEGRVADARTTLRRIEPTLREAVLSVSLWRSLRLKARLQIAAGELEAAEATIRDAEAVPNDLGPIDLAALDEQRAFLEAVRGEHEPARGRILAAFEQVAPTTHLKDLSRLLVEMIHLAALGLDLSDALPTIHELQGANAKRPAALDLPLRIAQVALRTDLGEVDASELERAAALARDPRLCWHQATMGAVGSLLSAQANLLGGERDAAASLLLEARQRAQHLEHVWLELRALQVGRDADLNVDPIRVRALVDTLKEHNPTDADRTAGMIAAWTSGMPRA